jgi:hypothetical protein
MTDSIAAEGETRNSGAHGKKEYPPRKHRNSLGKQSGRPLYLPVQRALHAHRALSEYVGVNHRRTHIGVAEQFLHCADIVASLEHVGSKAVPAMPRSA